MKENILNCFTEKLKFISTYIPIKIIIILIAEVELKNINYTFCFKKTSNKALIV